VPPHHRLDGGARRRWRERGTRARRTRLSRRRRLGRIRSVARATAGFTVFEVWGSAPDAPQRMRSSRLIRPLRGGRACPPCP
jgi:hypothetical protein